MCPRRRECGVVDVSGVRECHVKNKVLGLAAKGLETSDRRAIWREIVSESIT